MLAWQVRVPVLDLAIGVFLRHAVPLLDLVHELVALAADEVQVIVSQACPTSVSGRSLDELSQLRQRIVELEAEIVTLRAALEQEPEQLSTARQDWRHEGYLMKTVRRAHKT